MFGRIENMDIALFYWLCERLDHPFLVQAARAFSALGEWVSYVVLLPLFMFLFHSHSCFHLYYLLFLSLLIENTIYVVLKRSCRRSRPYNKLVDVFRFVNPPDQYSFPSGHTSSAFCLANALNHWFPQYGLLLFALASCMGLSRVILRVHFPLDVISGAALGIVTSQLVFLFSGSL